MDENAKTIFDKVIEVAKKVKMDWVEKTERGDIPPTLFVEREGKVVAIVMAPQVDKRAGLHAASLCRMGFRADALCMIFDAHIKEEKVPEGMSPEEAKQYLTEQYKNYKNGDMQRQCDEEGACELGLISDILLCHRIDVSGKMAMWTMPYAYHGKGAAPFRWLEDRNYSNMKMEEEGTKDKLEGFIPDSLREIMKQECFLDQDSEFMNVLRQKAKDFDLSPERQLYHIGRAVLRILAQDGFQVVDCQVPPEGVTPDPMLQKSVSLNDILPNEVSAKITSLLRKGNHPGLRDELLALLKPCEDEINKRATEFQLPAINVEELVDVLLSSFKKKKAAPKPPYKVKVWNGDQSEYLGEGMYVGDVPVYFIGMPDGSIRSFENAEEKPSDEIIAQLGGELIEAGNNPKIVLDVQPNDYPKVVYGCQVWWEPVTTHQHHEGCGCEN